MADTGAAPRVLLERYELREQVGLGGMGEVWIGRDRRLQRDVAVKLLLPQLSDEPSFRQRFEVEARAAAALEHPNVVHVYDIDDDHGALFIVMERLPGPSLDRRLAEGPMNEDEVRRVAADMLAGLGAAHAHHLIHRDIKPGNLIRSAGGRWKVGDFGVAKDLSSTAHLTLVGVAVGTPAYLAPEQLDGRPATPATDLWAAAVVLREALTGRRPFEGNDPIEVAHAIQHTQVPPLTLVRPDIDPGLAGAIDRALAFDPAQRFATAAEMLAAIEGRAPIPAPPPVAAPVAPTPAPAPDPEPGGPPPVPPTDASAGRSSSNLRILALVAAVAAALTILFLVSLVLGLVMFGDDDSDEAPTPTEPIEVPTTADPSTGAAEEQPTPTTEAPTEDPEGSAPGSQPPTTTPGEDPGGGLLPGDGPLGGTTRPQSNGGTTTVPASTTTTGVAQGDGNQVSG